MQEIRTFVYGQITAFLALVSSTDGISLPFDAANGSVC